jgi:hypothetical protein
LHFRLGGNDPKGTNPSPFLKKKKEKKKKEYKERGQKIYVLASWMSKFLRF